MTEQDRGPRLMRKTVTPPLVAQVVLGTSFFLVIQSDFLSGARGIEEEAFLEH